MSETGVQYDWFDEVADYPPSVPQPKPGRWLFHDCIADGGALIDNCEPECGVRIMQRFGGIFWSAHLKNFATAHALGREGSITSR